MSISQIFAMGGYGMFVWPAYFITLFAFGINLFAAWQEYRVVKKSIQQTLAQP